MTKESRRSRWSASALIAAVVDRLVWVCALIPYALIALVLRIVMARVFFLAGQDKITGPQFPIRLFPEWDLLGMSITLPAEIKPSVLQDFEAHYSFAPVSPDFAAYVVTYAEFIAPICLILGFATRFAAVTLLGLTILLALYVAPALWWSHQVYWLCLLLVLIARGPGAVSMDALLRYIYERD